MGLGDLPIVLSEVGQGSGGTPVNEADMVCYYQDVAAHDPYVVMVAFWNAGLLGNPQWELAQLNGHMANIAGAVAN